MLNILSLVAGIVSVVACCLYGFGILTGVAAIILSIQGKKKAEAGQANNPTLGKVGLILGIIGAALSAIYLILIIVGLSVNPSTFSSTS
ncbi:hypothetical protein [Actinocatenispora rupis]|uniref:hypothetical protein n=1 Tax=Actinocatenispora rupis TaxID=519421 RepID=UPI0019413899|nr:hypothetical protein [Actinocatenispora rupis]